MNNIVHEHIKNIQTKTDEIAVLKNTLQSMRNSLIEIENQLNITKESLVKQKDFNDILNVELENVQQSKAELTSKFIEVTRIAADVYGAICKHENMQNFASYDLIQTQQLISTYIHKYLNMCQNLQNLEERILLISNNIKSLNVQKNKIESSLALKKKAVHEKNLELLGIDIEFKKIEEVYVMKKSELKILHDELIVTGSSVTFLKSYLSRHSDRESLGKLNSIIQNLEPKHSISCSRIESWETGGLCRLCGDRKAMTNDDICLECSRGTI